MRNLIFANITCLRKNKLFWAGIVLSMIYSAFLLVINYLEMTNSSETAIMQLNWYFLSALSVAGIFCPIFSGWFIGTEYSDGTVRNKLIAGHKRSSIYSANVFIIFLAECLVFVAASLVVFAVGVPLFGCHFLYPMQFVSYLVSGILMLGAFSGVFTFISMLASSKAAAVAACMITYAVLFAAANFLRITVFSYYGEMPLASMSDETIRLVLVFLYDFLPTGQSSQISSGILLHPYIFPLYAIVNIVLTTACGLTIFKKKDLK